MTVLILRGDDDGHRAAAQGNVPHQMPGVPILIFHVVAFPFRGQVGVHPFQPVQVIGVVNVVHLLAQSQVLIPGKGPAVIGIVPDQRQGIADNDFLRLCKVFNHSSASFLTAPHRAVFFLARFGLTQETVKFGICRAVW